DIPGKTWPDVLLPLQAPPGAPVTTREGAPLFPRENRYQIIWVDIPVGEGPAAPTTLLATRDGVQKSLIVHIAVSKGKLAPPPLLIDLNEYGDKYLRHLPGDVDRDGRLAAEQAIYAGIGEHYGVLNPLPYDSQKGSGRRGMVPRLSNEDLLHPQLDWTEFDRRYQGMLSGAAMPDGRPIHHFYLPFNPNWPAPFALYASDRNRYEAIWAAFARAFADHFREKGWTQTIFQLYCNQKPRDGNDIPWNLDEPKGVDDYRALRYYADLTHRVFADAAPVQIAFRMDISHFYCDKHRGEAQKDFRVNGGWEILEPVDIWVISQHSLKDLPARDKARQLMAMGREIWEYGDTPRLDEGGSKAAARIYNAWEQGWNGIMAWRSFSREMGEDPGQDFIAYAINFGGNEVFVPSIRLKQLRRAVDDLRVLESAIGRGQTNQNAVLGRLKSRDVNSGWRELPVSR
ncbi:MAG: DUF4091 domain-containing protein, partial [Calditrichaeota bacterium]|nr:DUF4091 domain-containing protein [Calditrichota bacterium]